jgi:hypothetical protein
MSNWTSGKTAQKDIFTRGIIDRNFKSIPIIHFHNGIDLKSTRNLY